MHATAILLAGCRAASARHRVNSNPTGPFHFPSCKRQVKKGFHSIHTVSLYNLRSKRYLDVVVQPGRLKNEFAALCQLIDRYIYGGIPIFLADRGFASYSKPVPFDFITQSRPEYRMGLRVVRFQIAEGVYENIITNLPEKEFSWEQIKHLYHPLQHRPKQKADTGNGRVSFYSGYRL